MVALWHQLNTATLIFVVIPVMAMILHGFGR